MLDPILPPWTRLSNSALAKVLLVSGTPRHRIFQQSEDMWWEPVFERIVEALKEKVHG